MTATRAEAGKDLRKHEEGKEFKDVLDKFVGASNVFEARESDLGDDGSELSGCGAKWGTRR